MTDHNYAPVRENFLDGMLVFESDPGLLATLRAAEKDGNQDLFDYARRLLSVARPRKLNVPVEYTVGSTPEMVRQRVFRYTSGDGECELVLANTAGEDGYTVDDGVVSMYIREPMFSFDDFSPGDRLFSLYADGQLDGSVGDTETIEALLAAFQI